MLKDAALLESIREAVQLRPPKSVRVHFTSNENPTAAPLRVPKVSRLNPFKSTQPQTTEANWADGAEVSGWKDEEGPRLEQYVSLVQDVFGPIHEMSVSAHVEVGTACMEAGNMESALDHCNK